MRKLGIAIAIGVLLGVLAVGLLTRPAVQGWLLHKYHRQLQNYGVKLDTLPETINIFQGVTWNDLQLNYQNESLSVQFQAQSLLIEHSIQFFPFAITVHKVRLVDGKVTGELRPTTTASKNSGESFPISIHDIEFQNFHLDFRMNESPIRLNGLNLRSGLWTQNNQIRFHLNELTLASAEYPPFSIQETVARSSEEWLIRCLNCPAPQLDVAQGNAIEFRIKEVRSPELRVEHVELKAELSSSQSLHINANIENISTSSIQELSPSLKGTIKLDDLRPEVNLKVSATHKKNMFFESNWNSTLQKSGSIQIQGQGTLDSHSMEIFKPLLPYTRKSEFSLAGEFRLAEPIKNWLTEDYPKLLTQKVSTRLNGSITTESGALADFQHKQSNWNLKSEFNNYSPVQTKIGWNTAELRFGQYRLKDIQLLTNIEGPLESFALDTSMAIHSAKWIPVKLELKSDSPLSKRPQAKFQISIEESTLLDAKVTVDDQPQSTIVEMTTTVEWRPEHSLLLAPEPLSYLGHRQLQWKHELELKHALPSIRALTDFSSVQIDYTGDMTLTDMSESNLKLTEPATGTIRILGNTNDAKLNIDLKLPATLFNSQEILSSAIQVDVDKNGETYILNQFSGQSFDSKVRWSANGQVKQLSGQIDAKVRFDSPKKQSLGISSLQGTLVTPLRIAITEGQEFETEGSLDFENLSYSSKILSFERVNGSVPFTESFHFENGKVKFENLIVRNPFERVDYNSLQPLLLDAERLTIESIHFHERKYGPIVLYPAIEQNLISINQMSAIAGRGRFDGEMHIDFLPSQFSMSLLTRLQNIRLSEIIPASWAKRPINSDPLGGRLGLIIDIHKSTVDGRIDFRQISPGQLLSLVDVVDSEGENNQMNTLRTGLSTGLFIPNTVSIDLQEGFMDIETDLSLLDKIYSIPVSSLIRRSFAPISKQLNGVPIK